MSAAHGANQEGAIAQDPWHWRRSKAWAPAMGAVGEAPGRRQLAEPRQIAAHGIHGNALGAADGGDEAEEREKEIPRQLHNNYREYNGEYEKEHHGDLQLDEGEEEEDDDMDQIDYANDNANGADARQKHIKDAVPNVNKHDSVMVNPK